jgi:hypothetical protein
LELSCDRNSVTVKHFGAGTMTRPDEYYRAIIESMNEEEAINSVSALVRETIEDTRRTRMRVERALQKIGRNKEP